MSLRTIDLDLIQFFRFASAPAARGGLFVVYFWFGALKVIGQSPASPLVKSLFDQTVAPIFPSLPVAAFIAGFGAFECLIGLLFLIRGTERVVIPLLLVHLITTVLPLFLLPHLAWTGLFIPTLEGQYIIKNVLVVAAAIGIAAHLHPIGYRDN